MMGFFSWFKKKEVKEEPEVDWSWTNPQPPHITLQPQPVYQAPPRAKRQEREAGSPSEYVQQPEDFRWFKCQICLRKVLASKDEKMFYVAGDPWNNAIGPTKLCMECICDIAFEMGADKDEIKKAEKRKVLRCLKGDKK